MNGNLDMGAKLWCKRAMMQVETKYFLLFLKIGICLLQNLKKYCNIVEFLSKGFLNSLYRAYMH